VSPEPPAPRAFMRAVGRDSDVQRLNRRLLAVL
jgi:hypothetical protein